MDIDRTVDTCKCRRSSAELEVAEKELTATQTQEISASTDGMFQNL